MRPGPRANDVGAGITEDSQRCEQSVQGQDVEASLRSTDNIISLNLISNRTFTIKQRRVITQVTRAALSLCCLIVVILSIKIFATEAKIKHLRASYTDSDYQRAMNLTRRVQHIKNEQ